jgi:8-oxo-dGTP diphosphatase
MSGGEALTPVPCVGVVAVEDGALLLIRRRNPPSAGRWTLPGGRVEPGETLRAAARREALEETGLDLEIGGLLGTAEIDAPPERFLVSDYAARRRQPGTAPKPADDALDARFVPLEDVLDLDLADGVGRWLIDHGVLHQRI